jgi:diguanylate cyclase (GGDEF)-like protein
VVHAAFGLLQIAAGGAALLQGAEGDQRYLDLYLVINFLGMPAAYTGMALFMVFIMASDLAEEMRGLARTDPLTRLLNRRGFDEAALRALAQAQRGRRPLALVLGDVDRFKTINDTWGHGVGDRALQAFAEQLRRGRRKDDVVARVGGEEFALLLPNTDGRQAVELAEQIRRSLEHVELEARGERIALAASFGVAERGEGAFDAASLMGAADRALYRAKEAGRNQVRLDSGSTP